MPRVGREETDEERSVSTWRYGGVAIGMGVLGLEPKAWKCMQLLGGK